MMHWHLTIVAGVMLTGATGAAFAQNALGDGQALDANLGVGTGGRNQPISPRDSQYQLNNLIVTGNVAGGRGFRGSVGYSAPMDFRGATAEDDLFSFRAGSALSQLAYVTSAAGGSTLDLGQAMGLLEFRRSAAGADLMTIGQGVPTYGLVSMIESRINEISLIRSSQAGPLDPSAAGMLFAVTPLDDGGRLRTRVSEARGVQSVRDQTDVTIIGLTLFDQARLIEDQLEGAEMPMPGRPFQRDENLYRQALERIGDDAATDPASERMTAMTLDYDQVIAAIAVRDAERAARHGLTEELDRATSILDSIDRVQTYLRGQALSDQPEQDDPEVIEEFDPLAPILPDLGQGVPVLPPEQRSLQQIDISLLRHGARVDRLAPEGRTRLAEILRDAQTRLADRSYFFAERDFHRALRFHPNNPLAMAGLVNAQIGAGLVSAAASSLRNLYSAHPEMIDVRYGEQIVPPRERLDEVARLLRERVGDDAQPQRESGLLLAYIGHQTSRRDMVVEGLDLMQQADANDPLVIVLRGVWLGEERAPDDPGRTIDRIIDDDDDAEGGGDGG